MISTDSSGCRSSGKEMDGINEGELEAYRVEITQVLRDSISPYLRCGSSGDVADMFSFMSTFDTERLIVVCVDTKLRVSAYSTVSIGTLTASIVHPREVFKVAILSNSSGIIVVHNHPSGDPGPSDEDSRITERIAEAGNIMGIPLLDHVIIGDGSHHSFADAGDIGFPDYSMSRGMVLR